MVTNNGVMTTTNTSHFDDRFALEYRPHNDTALRFSAGSSIAPPFLSILSSAHNLPTCSATTQICTQEINNPNIRPETAFGYDLGGDHRFKDHVTTLSGDVYITTLSNQFITDYTYNSGVTFTCSPSISYCPTGAGGTYSIYNTSNVNLNRSRYEGIELRLHRTPAQGLGYSLQGALTRAYVYDLPADFYCSTGGTSCANPAQIGVVPNVNFNGGSYGSGISPAAYGVSNTNIPYLQAYAEANYRLRNGAYAQLGYTVYGKNNSLNEPPFGVTSASIRYPINKDLSAQISGYNILNEYPGLFCIAGQGVGYPLANGKLGATTAGQLGPATYRFSLTKTVGAF
jgi:outer membrane receptor protein involved in Fe transport